MKPFENKKKTKYTLSLTLCDSRNRVTMARTSWKVREYSKSNEYNPDAGS